MYLVRRIRNDKFHYLAVPEDILSWVKKDRIMKLGHIVPTLIVMVLIVVKILPLLSESYAEELTNNSVLITMTGIAILIPLLIVNGMLIETVLEKSNSQYKDFKNLGID